MRILFDHGTPSGIARALPPKIHNDLGLAGETVNVRGIMIAGIGDAYDSAQPPTKVRITQATLRFTKFLLS
jgi:hypothetical protein